MIKSLQLALSGLGIFVPRYGWDNALAKAGVWGDLLRCRIRPNGGPFWT